MAFAIYLIRSCLATFNRFQEVYGKDFTNWPSGYHLKLSWSLATVLNVDRLIGLQNR